MNKQEKVGKMIVNLNNIWKSNKNYVHHQNKAKVLCLCICFCLQKDLSNHRTDMVLLYIDPGKVYNYFGVGYHHPSKRNRPYQKMPPPPFKGP